MIDFSHFHFLRPAWLLALVPLLALGWWLLRRRRLSRSWQSVVDSQLLPHLLIGKITAGSRLPAVLFTLVGLLVIIALAGPVWKQLPQPVYREQSALVIALDLSHSMDAGDLRPSRLARARFKVSDILKMRPEGQTALIVYAGGAFTVSPLTDDADTIDALVPSLSSDMMPAQGSRADLALEQAAQLFRNAGVAHGDVLLITDGIGAEQTEAFSQLTAAGHRASILAVGTTDGAPIPQGNGGFLKDAKGAIVIPRLDINLLRNTALASGGRFSQIRADDADIKHLLGLLKINRLDNKTQQTEMQADHWQEQGPWLLLLAIPLAALAFRRGQLALLLALTLHSWSPPADALSWDDLWKNDNQIAAEKLQQQQAQQAAQLFTDPQWKAAAQYRAGDYAQAAQTLEHIDTADAQYNRGNALAKLGRPRQAIEAYQRALQLDPSHEDAKHNKQLLEQQQQKQNDEQSQDSRDDGQQSQQGDQQQQQNADKQQQGEQQQGQQQGEQQASDPARQQDGDSEDKQQQAQDANRPEQQDGDKQQTTQQAEQSEGEQKQKDKAQQRAVSDQQQQLSQQAAEQWLRRIPDDPGGLLRRKFEYQYKRQRQQADETQPW
jgi:Ca-activated chloride channel family protein